MREMGHHMLLLTGFQSSCLALNCSQSHQKHPLSLGWPKILKEGNKLQRKSYELYSNMRWPSVTRSCLTSEVILDSRWDACGCQRPSRAGTDPLCQALLGVWLLLILYSFIMGSAGIICEREQCFSAAGKPQTRNGCRLSDKTHWPFSAAKRLARAKLCSSVQRQTAAWPLDLLGQFPRESSSC